MMVARRSVYVSIRLSVDRSNTRFPSPNRPKKVKKFEGVGVTVLI
jgi:hypothetical protein